MHTMQSQHLCRRPTRRPHPLVGLSQKGKGSTSPHPLLAKRCSCKLVAQVREMPWPQAGSMKEWLDVAQRGLLGLMSTHCFN